MNEHQTTILDFFGGLSTTFFSDAFKISVEILVKSLKAKQGAFCARSRATGNKRNEV